MALLAACASPSSGEEGPRVVHGQADTAAADTAADSGAADTADTGTPADTAAADAPCSTFAAPTIAGMVTDGALPEISGLVVSQRNEGILWVLQDQGHDPVLTALDLTGATRGTLTLDGVANEDWEALALGPCAQGSCLYVGDVGDNDMNRPNVNVLRVPEPDIGGFTSFAATSVPEVQAITYPENAPHNAEGMALTPAGEPVLVTKRMDGTAGVFVLRTWDPTQTLPLEEVAWIVTGKPEAGRDVVATAADLTPDGSVLLVRTYGQVLAYPVTDGAPGDPTVLTGADEPQGETIAWDPVRRGFWQISEGVNPPMWFAGCAR